MEILPFHKQRRRETMNMYWKKKAKINCSFFYLKKTLYLCRKKRRREFESTSQRVYESTSQRVNKSTSQQVNKSTRQRVYESTSLRVNESTSLRDNESTRVRIFDDSMIRVFESPSHRAAFCVCVRVCVRFCVCVTCQWHFYFKSRLVDNKI